MAYYEFAPTAEVALSRAKAIAGPDASLSVNKVSEGKYLVQETYSQGTPSKLTTTTTSERIFPEGPKKQTKVVWMEGGKEYVGSGEYREFAPSQQAEYQITPEGKTLALAPGPAPGELSHPLGQVVPGGGISSYNMPFFRITPEKGGVPGRIYGTASGMVQQQEPQEKRISGYMTKGQPFMVTWPAPKAVERPWSQTAYYEASAKAFSEDIITMPFRLPEIFGTQKFMLESSALPGMGQLGFDAPSFKGTPEQALGMTTGYSASLAMWMLPAMKLHLRLPGMSISKSIRPSLRITGKIPEAEMVEPVASREMSRGATALSYTQKDAFTIGSGFTAAKVEGLKTPVHISTPIFVIKSGGKEGKRFTGAIYSEMRYFEGMRPRTDITALTRISGTMEEGAAKITSLGTAYFGKDVGQMSLESGKIIQHPGAVFARGSMWKYGTPEMETRISRMFQLTSKGPKPEISEKLIMQFGRATISDVGREKKFSVELFGRYSVHPEEMKSGLRAYGRGQTTLGTVMKKETVKSLHKDMAGYFGFGAKGSKLELKVASRTNLIDIVSAAQKDQLSILEKLPKLAEEPIVKGLGTAMRETTTTAKAGRSMRLPVMKALLQRAKTMQEKKVKQKPLYSQMVKPAVDIMEAPSDARAKDIFTVPDMIHNLSRGQALGQKQATSQRTSMALKTKLSSALSIDLKMPDIFRELGKPGRPEQPTIRIPDMIPPMMQKGADMSFGGRRKTGRKKKTHGRRRLVFIEKSLLADPLSVLVSQLRFGRATHPMPTAKIWAEAERGGFLNIPTIELRIKRKLRL